MSSRPTLPLSPPPTPDSSSHSGLDEDPLPPFFKTHSLTPSDRTKCLAHVRTLFPTSRITPLPLANQGGCSFTLAVESEAEVALAVQIRLASDGPSALARAHVAHLAYPTFAPAVLELDAHQLVLGERAGQASVVASPLLFRAGPAVVGERRVVVDLARFHAAMWPRRRGGAGRTAPPPPPPPVEGKIGASIVARLGMLARGLPGRWLRETAERACEHAAVWEGGVWPVVLTHGDLVPGNVLVEDGGRGGIVGIVDWAEAEDLPYGMSLYGLEYLLGWYCGPRDGRGGRWVWCDGARELRELFWETLEGLVPELRESGVRRMVELARTVGVLLWHGIAWDDGRLDRVVNEHDDERELVLLRAFLQTDSWTDG